jgi:hypothetical protein
MLDRGCPIKAELTTAQATECLQARPGLETLPDLLRERSHIKPTRTDNVESEKVGSQIHQLEVVDKDACWFRLDRRASTGKHVCARSPHFLG